jgi:Macrocin-O-methyltransferase (TylF)
MFPFMNPRNRDRFDFGDVGSLLRPPFQFASGRFHFALLQPQLASAPRQRGIRDRMSWARSFKDTVAAAPVKKIAVLRLDGDLDESTIQVLEGFYPRLLVGGFCIIDDYGAMLSCRAAVEDFRRNHGVGEAMVDIDGKGVLSRKIVGSGDAGGISQGETGGVFTTEMYRGKSSAIDRDDGKSLRSSKSAVCR